MLEKTDQRTIFLQLFIKELISNSAPKINLPSIREERADVRTHPPKKVEISQLASPEFTIGETAEISYETSIRKEGSQIPGSGQRILPLKRAMPEPKESPVKKPYLITQFKKKFTAPIKTQKSVPHLPSPKPAPGEKIDLGRLNTLATDKEVTIIECPGPDKFVLVKKSGRINMTKIKLSESEINRIINNFSEKARIPLLEGIFKAIVGNFSINAVITNSLGSRFLIYKKSPYSLID